MKPERKSTSLSVSAWYFYHVFVAQSTTVSGTLDENEDYYPTSYWENVGYAYVWSDPTRTVLNSTLVLQMS